MRMGKTGEHEYPPAGVYEHYKSTPADRRYYQVLGCARQTETGESLVIYVPLYTIPEHKGLRIQARPLDMFMESVQVGGKMVPRFRYVGAEL